MYDENTAAMKIQVNWTVQQFISYNHCSLQACYKTYSTRKQLVRCLKSALEEFEIIDRSLGDCHSVEELYNPTDHFLFKVKW